MTTIRDDLKIKLKDKKYLFCIIIILLLAIIVRFSNYSSVEYWSDDVGVVPHALLWYYPYPIYPGLSGTAEPGLSHLIIGKFCLMSQEDFSRVSEIQPGFLVGRPELIGKQLVNADNYCHLPMYIFGLLFLITMIVLAILLLDKPSSLFMISFISFYPSILELSRFIHPDIIQWFFITCNLLFLWKAYSIEKSSKKELTYFILSSIFIGLAFATKFTSGIFIPFFIAILYLKYKEEVNNHLHSLLNKLNIKIKKTEERNTKPLIKIILGSIIAFNIAFWPIFKFSLTTLIQVIKQQAFLFPRNVRQGFNPTFYEGIKKIILQMDPITTIAFLFSFYICYLLIKKKDKTKEETFILSLFILYIITILLSKPITDEIPRLSLLLILIAPILSLTFSNKAYSLLNKFKIHSKIILYLILIVLIILGSYNSYTQIPKFAITNPLVCPFFKEECNLIKYNSFLVKPIANKLNEILKEEETFEPNGYGNIMYYYTRQEEDIQNYGFKTAFKEQIGRPSRLEEKILYWHPFNRTIRYLVIIENAELEFPEESTEIQTKLLPAYRFDFPNQKGYIYDLNSIIVYNETKG